MIKKVHGRHGSRWLALQGLYAWQVAEAPLAQIIADLIENNLQFDDVIKKEDKISFDKPYFHELMENISHQRSTLDELILPHLDRALDEVHSIEHAILWIAIYELKDRIETPYRVIINEAIILAKKFGAQDSHKFVNGVLDKAAKEIRARECVVA